MKNLNETIEKNILSNIWRRLAEVNVFAPADCLQKMCSNIEMQLEIGIIRAVYINFLESLKK